MPTYFLTFTTYGTWLHGDARGSVERRGKDLRGKQLGPDSLLETANRRRMTHPALTLNAPVRGCVRRAIVRDCEVRQRRIVALAVRTNHVHIVLESADPIERVLHNVKAWATHALRDDRLAAADQPVWTGGGNKVVLTTDESIARAVDYVLNQQGGELSED